MPIEFDDFLDDDDHAGCTDQERWGSLDDLIEREVSADFDGDQ